jgi:hypothetical protein
MHAQQFPPLVQDRRELVVFELSRSWLQEKASLFPSEMAERPFASLYSLIG